MILVPYTVTALAESDAVGTEGKNIVVGAVVTLQTPSGGVVTMFDNAAGDNGSTAKTTGSKGFVVVFVEAGEYQLFINGNARGRVVVAIDAEALAAPDSDVPVGGVPAGNLALAKWFFVTPRDIDTTGSADATAIINAALAANSHVALPAGNIKITGNLNIAGKVLLGQGKEKTNLICASPTGNNRFGGLTTSQAAVFSNGVNGAPVFGSTVIGLSIDCNGLLNSTGATGLKGVMFRKSHGCYAKDIRVIDSSSYAYWCSDDILGTDYASAVFEDCEETGSEIGFEAVNVTTCRFVRCKAIKPRVTSAWPVFNMFHAYALKDDALVTFESCYGRGYSSTVVDLLLKCRNIQFIGGYFEQLDSGNSALFFSLSDANFSSIEFGGAVFISAGFGGVLTSGALGASGQKAVKFIGGSITANSGIGLELQSNNAVYEFVGTDIKSVRASAAALCFVSSGAGNIVQFTGGSLTASGGAGSAISQGVDMRVSQQTIQSPSTSAIPQVKQLSYGRSALALDGDYSFFNADFNFSANTSKLVVSAFIDATGAASGNAAAALARPLSFAIISNSRIRFYGAQADAGLNVNWEIKEYA